MSKLTTPTLLATPLLLLGCNAVLNPDWTASFTHGNSDTTHMEWLDHIKVDSYGDILLIGDTVRLGMDRQQNVSLVKYNAQGHLQWAMQHDTANGEFRSDDNVSDAALDDDDNVYVVGTQYRVQNGQGSHGSFLLKADRFGEVLWSQQISSDDDVYDVEVIGERIYLTGQHTQVFDLEGQPLLDIANTRAAWDVEVDSSGAIFVAGYQGVSKYNANGELQWQTGLGTDLSHQASLLLGSDGRIFVGHKHMPSAAGQLSALSASGQVLWQKTLSDSANDTAAFPGPALIKAAGNDVVFVFSSEKARTLSKFSRNGQKLWQANSSTGIAQDLAVHQDGSVYVVGAGLGQKYDANGRLLGETARGPSASLTTGSIALTNEASYMGYSALLQGSNQLYLAKYRD